MSWIYRSINQPSVQTLWRAYRYLRPYWRYTAGAYLTLLLVNAFNVVIPQFIRWIVDRGIAEQNLSILAWSVLGLLTLTLLKVGVHLSSGLVDRDLPRKAWPIDVRNAIQNKLTTLSFSYHDRSETGQFAIPRPTRCGANSFFDRASQLAHPERNRSHFGYDGHSILDESCPGLAGGGGRCRSWPIALFTSVSATGRCRL